MTFCLFPEDSSNRSTFQISTIFSLFLGDFFDDIGEELHITRDEFNQICEKLFNKIEKITKDTLEDANLKNTDINEILMIGGSSRMPKVQAIMESIFPGKKLNNSLHPDEAVAYGAAICAAQRNKATEHEVPKINLLEATPLAYGTDLAGGLFGVVIPKNSTIPIEKSVKRTTIYNNQTSMHFSVIFHLQAVSDETYLFYFDIAFFWKSILNFRLLENNELICLFYACFFVLKIFTLGKIFSPGLGFEPTLLCKKREPYHSAMKVGCARKF
jgi:molecular chaperone DnaK (HSP70)